ncbi:MAG: hypothetical protein P4L51_10120 [Puia sp.]|nr:hypothetical protein [Puia sp.]
MFDEILQLVKEHVGGNPQIAAAIPPEQADAIHHEIATHINDGLQNQAATPAAGGGGILSTLENSLSSGNLMTSSVVGGLIGSLGNKFGLPSAVTGAIAASLPGLVQRFTQKAANPAAPATPAV